MLNRPVHVAICCDYVIVDKLLAEHLAEQPDIHVLQTPAREFESMNPGKNAQPDVLLLGMFCPEAMDPGRLQHIREKSPQLKIIVLSVSTDPKFISSLMEYGIFGYISPDDRPQTVVKAVLTVSQNKIFPTRLVTEAMYLNKQHNIKTTTLMRTTHLTDRDKRILQLLWEEKSNKQIAEELFLSIRSVEKLRQNIKRKLGAKSTIGMLKHIIQ